MKGECLRANYRQYGLESRYLDVLIADAASLSRLLRTSSSPYEGLFDAIVTDPPYGVRERSCRVASEVAEKEPSLQTAMFIHQITGEYVPPAVLTPFALLSVQWINEAI